VETGRLRGLLLSVPVSQVTAAGLCKESPPKVPARKLNQSAPSSFTVGIMAMLGRTVFGTEPMAPRSVGPIARGYRDRASALAGPRAKGRTSWGYKPPFLSVVLDLKLGHDPADTSKAKPVFPIDQGGLLAVAC
jgi:hypothetical protein